MEYDDVLDEWEINTINGVVRILIAPEIVYLSMREIFDLYDVVEYYDDPWLYYKQMAAQSGEEFDPTLYIDN